MAAWQRLILIGLQQDIINNTAQHGGTAV